MNQTLINWFLTILIPRRARHLKAMIVTLDHFISSPWVGLFSIFHQSCYLFICVTCRVWGITSHSSHRHSALSAVWSGCSTWTVSGTWHSSCPWRWGPSPSWQHCHPPSAWCQTFNINPGVQLSMFYVTLHIDSCWVSKQNPEHPGDFFVLVAPLPLHLSSKCKIKKNFEDHFRLSNAI